ncbi:MAG: hypothetical protein R3A45_13470 [Bdellovibrionota bacterium]
MNHKPLVFTIFMLALACLIDTGFAQGKIFDESQLPANHPMTQIPEEIPTTFASETQLGQHFKILTQDLDVNSDDAGIVLSLVGIKAPFKQKSMTLHVYFDQNGSSTFSQAKGTFAIIIHHSTSTTNVVWTQEQYKRFVEASKKAGIETDWDDLNTDYSDY